MDKKKLRNRLEALYNWQSVNVGTYTESFEVIPGLELTVKYRTTIAYGDYEFIVHEAKVKVEDESDKILKRLGFNVDDVEGSDFVEDAMTEYLEHLVDECTDLFRDLDEDDRISTLRDITDLDEISSDYDTFEDLWNWMESELGEETEFFTINDEYVAEFKKGNKYVTVGCQDIPIDKIRALVVAYDKFQKG
jgi:hypothetical protein